MKRQISYKDLGFCIRNSLDFALNRSATGSLGSNGVFTIVSYSTPIMKFHSETMEVLFFNEEKYSATTSRLQNFLRKLIEEGDLKDVRSQVTSSGI